MTTVEVAIRPDPATLLEIPALAELGKLAYWVLWEAEERNGKLNKVPKRAVGGGNADVKRKATQTTSAAALRAYDPAKHGGLGFVFHKECRHAGVDLDGCRNPETGQIAEWAWQEIRAANTYCEVSPSGTGVKLFGRGSVPQGRKCGAIEVYDTERFFAVTGHHVPDTPDTLNDISAYLADLWPRLEALRARRANGAAGAPILVDLDGDGSEVDITDKLKELLSKPKSNFARSWRHDQPRFKDQSLSSYDLSLCTSAAFKGWSDPELAALIAAHRAKHGDTSGKAGRKDYLVRTVAAARAGAVRMAEHAAARAAKALELGSDVEIGRRVLADLAAKFGRIVYADGAFFRWAESHWAEIPEETLRLAVHFYDGATYPTAKEDGVIRLNRARVDSVISEMKPGATDREFFANAPAGVNCQSGFIRFDGNGGPELVPHAEEQRQRHVLPGRWTSGIPFELPKKSLLHKLLHGCFEGDADAAEKTALLQEIAGVVVTTAATKLRNPKAAVLWGESAENGKSQILNLLRALVPAGAVTSISPRHFGDGRYIVKLAGKLLNAPDELGGEAIASEDFKKAITGDEITARDVYKSSVEFKPLAQHVCATNVLPPFRGGMDRGVRRRLLVIEFHRVIPMEERVQDIGRRIGEEEPDLLLVWAVEGAKRVLKRRGFAEPESSRRALIDWCLGADLVLAWLEDEEEIDYGDKFQEELSVRTRDAYAEFRHWAEEDQHHDRHRLPDLNGFTQRVRAAGKKGVGYKRTETGRHFTGFALKKVRRLRKRDPSEAGIFTRDDA